MIVAARIWSKVRRDQVLNLSELAHASGYDRGMLSKLALPLIAGKISLSDFKRILRKRQDRQERIVKVMPPLVVSSGSANNGRRQAIADKFYVPSSKRVGKSASRPARSAPLRSSA